LRLGGPLAISGRFVSANFTSSMRHLAPPNVVARQGCFRTRASLCRSKIVVR
jgi:hypothetical protein